MSFVKRFALSLESLYVPEKNSHYVVAFSGGVDSHVLLHCCRQLDLPVRAVHVHHGLQHVADEWVKHCQNVCDALGVKLEIIYVDAARKKRQSPEESARIARYEALQKNLVADDCLLTAQHRDDQAETLMLQLLRTASAAGLSAMPAVRSLGDNVQCRPLLSFTRDEIVAYAEQNDLKWVEDPSNQDVSFDRNYVRKKVLPVLKERWSDVSLQLSNVADQQSDNFQVLQDMARTDLANILSQPQVVPATRVFEVLSILSIEKAKRLSSYRLLNLLRYWVTSTLDVQPTRNLLVEIENSLIHTQSDADPKINFSGFSFRKFRNNVFLIRAGDNPVDQPDSAWDVSASLRLPGLNIQMHVIDATGTGLDMNLLQDPVTVRFRRGSEKFHPAERQHSQSLKKLLQEARVPPWERDVIPLIYIRDELVAVAGLWVCKRYAVQHGGWSVSVENI